MPPRHAPPNVRSARAGAPSSPRPWPPALIVGVSFACTALVGFAGLFAFSRAFGGRSDAPQRAARPAFGAIAAARPIETERPVPAAPPFESGPVGETGMPSRAESGAMVGEASGGAMRSPSDGAPVSRVLQEIDARDGTSPATDWAAKSDGRRVVGRDWLPRAPRGAAGRRDAALVAAEIDGQIERRLLEAGVAPAPAADDAEFLRRAFLDLHGHVPARERAVAFLDDRSPDKRARLIDELLEHPDFGFRLAHYWRDLLVKRDSDKTGLPNEPVFVSWLARRFNSGRGWDRIVHEMLTAEGDEALAGETLFLLANEDDMQPAPNKIVASASALFMGIQLQCAECHVHPVVEHWTPQDFWGLAAFFAGTRVDRQSAGKGKQVVAGTGELSQRIGGKGGAAGTISIPDPKNDGRSLGTARAHLFESDEAAVEPRAAHRRTLADWLASADDPYFAPAAANRIWSILFAHGLVEPLDDLRPDNPPTHPEVLALLAREFVASEFDVKHLVRALCHTRAYQRTSRRGSSRDDHERLYAHATVKVLTAEMLFDSLAVATDGRVARGTGAGSGDAAAGPLARFGTVAFFDVREYDDSAGEYAYGIPQLLRLMNRQLTAACDEIGRETAASGPRDRAIERLYLTVHARRPTSDERARIERFLERDPSVPPEKVYGEVLWALLNSAEFFCNR